MTVNCFYLEKGRGDLSQSACGHVKEIAKNDWGIPG